jgi:hypothetical protein
MISLEHILPFVHLDDNSYDIAIYELAHGPVNYNTDRLETLLFNPVHSSHSSASIFLNNLDPEQNFPFLDSPSIYFVEDELNSLISTNAFEKPGFSVMHINARSLCRNFENCRSMLARITHQFSVIGISETWLTDQTLDTVNTQGYNFISNHRKSKTGGWYWSIFTKSFRI